MLTGLLAIVLILYTGQEGTYAVASNAAKPLPSMTMVYETYGASISLGDRSIDPFKEVHRLEYRSKTDWVDTVIESPSIDLGRYGVRSYVGSYKSVKGNTVIEYTAADGGTYESSISEHSTFYPGPAFPNARGLAGFTDDLAKAGGIEKSQVVTGATVCSGDECRENVTGDRYTGNGLDMVVLTDSDWVIPLRMGDGFLVRKVEIHDDGQ